MQKDTDYPNRQDLDQQAAQAMNGLTWDTIFETAARERCDAITAELEATQPSGLPKYASTTALLEAISRDAVLAEREQCCRDVCLECADGDGYPPKRDARGNWLHGSRPCNAMSIRERAYKAEHDH